MKKIYFGLLIALCVLAFSCHQDEATLSTEKAIETTSLISQATAWKTIPISKNLITNQRAISHLMYMPYKHL